MSFRNLQDLLEATASHFDAGRVITYSHGNKKVPFSCSYGELLHAAKQATRSLQFRTHIRPGSVVLLHFDRHWDGILWFWAVLLAGCIPAMSTPFSGNPDHRAAHLEHLAQTLENPVCLTTASQLLEFQDQDVITPICVESLLNDKNGNEAMEEGSLFYDSQLNDTAVLMLTSGSTGYCKAVCLSHGQILAAIAGKSWMLTPSTGTSLMNWVGLDHVAALIEIHLQGLYIRRDQIHLPAPDVLTEPLCFIEMINRHRVSRTFAPNFFLAKLRTALKDQADTDSESHWDLSCLRFICSGGEANVTRTCEEVSSLLVRYGAPPNVIIPGFGMTETCAGAIFNTSCPRYDIEHALKFTSVGACMPGIKMRITSAGQNVPAGTVGSLEVSGPVVFKAYFNNPTATEASFTPDGWFKTGDRALIDQNGWLTLMGRSRDTMIVNGVKYNPQEIESTVDDASIPGVTPTFTCCFSCFPPGGDTEEIILVYLPSYDPDDTVARVHATDAIVKVVMMSTGARPSVLPVDGAMLQKSALGKLSRGKIKTAYERGDYKTYQETNREMIARYREDTRQQPQNEMEQRLLSIFTTSLAGLSGDFDVVTPILDMGISSIELIKLKKNLEEHLDLVQDIPPITLMINPTVRSLAEALEDAQRKTRYDPVVILQSQGDKPPLWLVHPGVGEVMVFLNLARYIVDRPVYALRARGFDEGETPFETIHEVITTYHASIKKKQAKGPYALAGYSYGSILAFEIGKTLEHNGDEVAFLGSFNLPPHIKARMRQLCWKECLLHLCYFLDLISERRAQELSGEMGNMSRGEILSRVMSELNQSRYLELSLSLSQLEKWATIAFSLQSMAVDYDPSESIACIDVFYCNPLAIVASSKRQWFREHLSKWKDFTRSEPRFHEVEGAHYTMLNADHVFAFQKTLRKALAARGL
ncbi:non-ribosomal peptide synthetase [Aspergillus thermomutatus]|uniref:Carrier domain-containing protein n=1 Tax=Aspergillus thermomutatus TaxID=41047 RepID=A0A397G7C3_ASPTH|nr:uncharacterized protein CDV56_103323 [Aspergillus thermomutatus]RHZ46497.1 hypothetical protein CDV56_103323 [Aspergillus thermomutatus]